MTRFVKRHIWWSSVMEQDAPAYLYWDESTEHFEIGCRTTAAKHKWEFTDEDKERIESEYPILDDFMTEMVKNKGGNND